MDARSRRIITRFVSNRYQGKREENDPALTGWRWLGFSRLLKNARKVIARSVFREAAISKLLISLQPRLLRFARKDGKKTFPVTC
jgi:hypothetical protein